MQSTSQKVSNFLNACLEAQNVAARYAADIERWDKEISRRERKCRSDQSSRPSIDQAFGAGETSSTRQVGGSPAHSSPELAGPARPEHDHSRDLGQLKGAGPAKLRVVE